MPVDRHLFNSRFSRTDLPAWRCPTCQAGHLKLLDGSLRESSTSETEAALQEDWFGPEHSRSRFIALLKCDNARCKESAVISGRGEVDEVGDWANQKLTYEDLFQPTHFCPSPSPIVVPPKTPAEVRAELAAAFVAMWGDQQAAGNHIRSAVELLLNALRVRKTSVSKGKKIKLSLHSRIDLLKTTHAEVHSALLAVKWIGNAGSHEAIDIAGVFDALDIFEAVLQQLFVDHSRVIAKLVAKVNERRGPVRR